MRKIGVYGGSFNPVHVAHLVSAELAREALGLDLVLFVPAGAPPHKPSGELAPARDRMQMVLLAIAGNPAFAASAAEVRREGPSYTVDTVRSLQAKLGPDADLYFIIGLDTVSELPTWKSVRELVRLCKFVPMSRPGARRPSQRDLAKALGADEARAILSREIRMPLLDIASSDIRCRIIEGRSIRYLVPKAVETYIRKRGLYRTGITRRAAPTRRSPARHPRGGE